MHSINLVQINFHILFIAIHKYFSLSVYCYLSSKPKRFCVSSSSTINIQQTSVEWINCKESHKIVVIVRIIMITTFYFNSDTLSSLCALLYCYLTYYCILTLSFTLWWAASEMPPSDPYLLVFTPLCHLLPLCLLPGSGNLSLMNRVCRKSQWWDDKKNY